MNKEQFQEWRNNPTTAEVMEAVKGRKIQVTEQLVSGATIRDLASTARCVGQIEGLNQLLNITYLDKEEEEYEE